MINVESQTRVYAMPKNGRLLLRQAFEQIDDAENEEGECAADGDCGQRQQSYSFRNPPHFHLLTRKLTFPASARPPSTARPVQIACPDMAPSVTHQ